jgi:hypothetical protein
MRTHIYIMIIVAAAVWIGYHVVVRSVFVVFMCCIRRVKSTLDNLT